MSLQTRLSDLISNIGSDVKDLSSRITPLEQPTYFDAGGPGGVTDNTIDGGASPTELYNTPGPLGNQYKSIVMLGMSSANETVDLNTTAGKAVPWDVTEYIHSDWDTDGAETIIAQFDGMAWFSVQLEITSAVQRANLRLRIEKNQGGISYLKGAGAGGYVRAVGGHDEASIYLRVFDPNVTRLTTYRVWAEQYAAGGVVNPIADGSYFSADRLI